MFNQLEKHERSENIFYRFGYQLLQCASWVLRSLALCSMSVAL